MTRKDGDRVRLYSRPGNELTDRFPLIVKAVARLRSIDGEAVCCGEDGVLAAHHQITHFEYEVRFFIGRQKPS